MYSIAHLYLYIAKAIIIATTTAVIHSMITVTDTPIATDWLSCFHPVALVLDGDVKRSHVLIVCVRVGVAVRLSGDINPTSEKVLDGDVNENCIYSVCVRVNGAVRLSGEINPTSEMVLDGDVIENCAYTGWLREGMVVRLSGVEVDPVAMVLAGVL